MSPANQWKLYDNDETTCTDIRDYVQGNAFPYISLKMNWDPTLQNTQATAAMYKCKSDFFANVTHGNNVKVSVYRGDENLSTANIANKMVSYSPCLTLYQTESGQFLRTKFHCSCTALCHILLRLSLFDVNEAANSTVCTVKLYY